MAHLDTDLLKPTDVARRLGVSRSWIYDAEDVECWLEHRFCCSYVKKVMVMGLLVRGWAAGAGARRGGRGGV